MNIDKPNSDSESKQMEPNQDISEVSAPVDSALINPNMETGKSLMVWIVSIITFVALSDQITKSWALETLSDTPGGSIPVIGDFLRWTLVFNEGGAMGTNLGGSTLYSVVGVAILSALGYYLWRYRSDGKIAIPLALIAGGAIGNLIDRFQLGKVVDWIDVDFFNISIMNFQLERWWTFNIADSAISVALVYMLWYSLFPGRHSQMSSSEDSPSEKEGDPLVIQSKESS